MRKILFVLAVLAVLGLGGCSVSDDDNRVENNGDENMSVTVYPNVVEASRIAVDGGYLVEYSLLPSGEYLFFDFVNTLWNLIGIPIDYLSSFSADVFLKKVKSLEILFGSVDNKGGWNGSFYRLSLVQKTVYGDSGEGGGFFVMLASERYGSNSLYQILQTGKYGDSVSSKLSESSITYPSDSSKNVLSGRFTIFEPKE